MNKLTKLAGAAAAATLVAVSGSAFTAGNTVNAGTAGSGTNAITGYDVSNVQYDANATNPKNLDKVRFTLDKSARYVAIKTHSAGQWFRSDDLRLGEVGAKVKSCTNTTGFTWVCNVTGATPNETVAAANSLTVVATARSHASNGGAPG